MKFPKVIRICNLCLILRTSYFEFGIVVNLKAQIFDQDSVQEIKI